MKIVYLITELSPAGAEQILTDLVCGMVKRGHTCNVVSLMAAPEDMELVDRIRAYGVQISFLNASKFDFAVLPFLVRYALLHLEPEIVHSHLMHPNLLSRLALFGTGIPLVNTIHIADHRRGQKFYFMLDRMTFHSAGAVTAVSKAAARFHAATCRIAAKEFTVICNGCDPIPPATQEECNELRTGCAMADCSKIIGSVGRLDYQKGYDRLFSRLHALETRVPKDERWGLIILGDGPERSYLETKMHQMNFAHLRVALPGFRENAAQLMNTFDAFVMPSRYEGYGLTLVEAMTFGLPIVTSGVDSLSELCRLYQQKASGFARCVDFSHDTNGKMLADALTDAVKTGRSKPCIIHPVSEMVNEYESLYNKLLG